MPTEIERKFLISSDDWKASCTKSIRIRQGYLSKDKDRTVRVRLWDDVGKITIKGLSVQGVRPEYEYDIPKIHAEEMLNTLCLPGIVDKIRHCIPWDGLVWEVDEFLDHNTGLVLAEIELPSMDTEFEIPSWIGKEVTNDHRFQNSFLAANTLSSSLKTSTPTAKD